MNTVKNNIPSYKNEILALEQACFHDIFSFLGAHKIDNRSYEIRVYLPGAEAVHLITTKGSTAFTPLNGSALFVLPISSTKFQHDYQLEVNYPFTTVIRQDPYRFQPAIDPDAMFLFSEGKLQHAYQHFGAHFVTQQQVEGVRFTLWAPNAQSISVIADFNHWNSSVHFMRKHPQSGIWELFIPSISEGSHYKYHLVTATGEHIQKADPFAHAMQKPPETASRLVNNKNKQPLYPIENSKKLNTVDAPISIYEVHAGSWRRNSLEKNRYLTYRELAIELVEYVIDMGFTHVQFMPLNEFPFDGSWGYQPVGMFTPSSRFGSAEDFKYLINAFHQAGIGVLLDWVAGHFPADPHGLAKFDGSHLYEHADSRQGYHPDWHTHIYNYGRNEVRSFLMSSAHFWLEEFGLDGLRVDAVASMLYLDYSRKEGQWLPNPYGGRENLDAISLLQEVNSQCYQINANIMMAAEESTAWPGVTNFVEQGGLGFGFKWNMGWMNDSLGYMSQDPLYRKYHHHQMTFSMIYAFSENYILPLSHDEVVHGKGSLINKMPGDDWQKFANLRCYFGFMWSHPGKKLLFMGGEFAQWDEWDHDKSLDWHLLKEPRHQGMQLLIKELNHLYRHEPALYQLDNNSNGFQWIDSGNAKQSIFSYIRFNQDHDQAMLCIVNMTPEPHHDFCLGVPNAGIYQQKLNTDDLKYCGSHQGIIEQVSSNTIASHGHQHSITLTIPPLACLWLKWVG